MKFLNCVTTITLIGLTLMASSSFAEDIDSAERNIEEVIITVERREVNLQDYAGTAVSFSGEELEMGGIINIADLAENVPGLDIGQSGTNLEVWVRGIGSSNNTELGDPAAAFHFNGVYIPRPAGIGSAFFDIARVEVNVGPQGTLRGRNAMAGSINAITWEPGLDQWQLSVEGELGNYGQEVFRGMVNAPIGDTMAARLAIYSMQHDSYMTDVSSNAIGVAEAEDNFGARLQFLYEPSGKLRMLLAYDYLLEQGTGWTGSNYANLLGNDIDPQSIKNPRSVYARAFEPILWNPHWGIKFQVNYDLGFADLEYIYGYRDLLSEYQAATPLTPDYEGVRGNLAPLDEALDNWSSYQSITDSESSIHELRLVSPQDETFFYTVGLFYFEENQSTFLASTGDRAPFFQGFEFNQPNTDSDSFSIYTDVTWNYTDTTRFTVGLRYSDDHKERQGVNANYRFMLQGVNEEGVAGRFPLALAARVGTEGFKFAGTKRTIFNPDDPKHGGNEDGILQPLEFINFYLDGIEAWGANDTIDEIVIALQAGGGSLASGDPNLPDCPDTNSADEIFTPIGGKCLSVSIDKLDSAITVQDGQVDDNFLDWRLRVEHDINDDFLTYGLIATGHKTGGFNDNFPNRDNPITYDTEQVILYELGFKNTFDLGSVPTQLNGSLFFNDYTDQVFCNVVSVVDGDPDDFKVGDQVTSTGVNFCFNAADSSISGLQLDGKFFLPWDLTFSWKYLYLDAKIDEAEPIQDSRYQADVEPENARFIDISGNRLPRTAQNQFNFSLGQAIDLTTGRFDYLVSVGYRDDHYLSIYNSLDYSDDFQETGVVEARLDDRVKGYWTVDLGVGYNHGDTNLRIEGYVNNLTDVVQPTAMLITQDSNTRFFTRPKIYGIRVKWQL